MATALRWLNQGALGLAGVSILLMTALGGLDVLGSVFLNRPLPATYEATETLMVLVVFLSLSHLQARRAHIAVDILFVRMPAAAQRTVVTVSHVLAFCFFALIAWQGWELAWQSLSVREYAAGIVAFPLYPSKFALAVGATLAAIQCLADLLTDGLGPSGRD